MTYYVNNRITSHIWMASLAFLATVVGASQATVPFASAATLIPRPDIVTSLSVHPDSGTIVVDEVDEAVPPPAKIVKTLKVTATAYTSTVEECDADPFITADGSDVADGIIATNVLPFGTKVRIPALFGDRVFEVHDRMNARYSYRIDFWMADKAKARAFGVKRNVLVEVIEMGNNKTQWAARAEKIKHARMASRIAQAIAFSR